MKVMIAGGSGFLGRALTESLRADQHEVWVLTRRAPRAGHQIQWDGVTPGHWSERLGEMDALINLAGLNLAHWPWTRSRKKAFIDSRVQPGLALTAAIRRAAHRPAVLVQASGINRYGLRAGSIADESTPPGDDYLAQLTVPWEESTRAVEDLGVRRVILRQASVLSGRGGMLPLTALPVGLFIGGRIGDGRQAMPWIHLADQIGAVRSLLENPDARGAFNLVAPTPTSNAEFMQALARALGRPYWLPAPVWMLRLMLGEMHVLLTQGRYSRPQRLLDLGYRFQYPRIEEAFAHLAV